MRPHAVLVPCPLQGHINPMLHFAETLVAHHGFVVTFVTNHHYYMSLLQRHRDQSALQLPAEICMSLDCGDSNACMRDYDPRLSFDWVEDGLPDDFDYSDMVPPWLQFREGCLNMQAPLKDLIQSLNSGKSNPPVSCIVFGSFFPWAHYVAKELAIPSVFFWTQSAVVFSIYYHMPLLVVNGFYPYRELPEGDKSARDLISYIPGVPPFDPADLPSFLLVEDTDNSLFKAMEEQFATLKDCSGVVINSFKELEEEAYAALQKDLLIPAYFVGPLLSSPFLQANQHNADVAALKEEEKNPTITDQTTGTRQETDGTAVCISWLQRQPAQAVLYISFGTLFHPPHEILQGIAMAMVSMKQRFLWVLRCPSTVSDMSHVFPQDFKKETRDYGLVVPWAPQLEVLAHPSVGAFLTHCGWNSTIESMNAGIPLIACSVASDQAANGRFVADIWKIGLCIKKPNTDMQQDCLAFGEEVEKAVTTIFRGEEGQIMRGRASQLKDVIRGATARGSSYASMHDFAKWVRQLTT